MSQVAVFYTTRGILTLSETSYLQSRFQRLVDYLIELNFSNTGKPFISDYHATNHQRDKNTEAQALRNKQIFTSICFVIAKNSSRQNMSRVPFAC